MDVSDFDFLLPPESIAQRPVPRGTSRLMTLDRGTGATAHRSIADLPSLLRSGDVLVVNDTRVIPARLFGLPYGTLAEGAPADVVLFSTSRTTTFASFRSLSANSPWAGKTLKGRVERTFFGGREVYRHGAAAAAAT